MSEYEIIYKDKCDRLKKIMKGYAKKNVAIAFSGGVDSSLLLKFASDFAKNANTKVYAITLDTELHSVEDIEIASEVAKKAGVRHIILSQKVLDNDLIQNNPTDRCYQCKKMLFSKIMEKAALNGADIVMDGTNTDDMKVYRPGIRALEELGVKSPLREVGFSKADVRKMAAEYGISVSDRPSAPCLATRFPYGTLLTAEKIKKVDEAEQYIKSLGYYNVRVRVHGEIARIEVGENELTKLVEHRDDIVKKLKKIGYSYITVDLEGFRSGSMDIHITDNDKK